MYSTTRWDRRTKVVHYIIVTRRGGRVRDIEWLRIRPEVANCHATLRSNTVISNVSWVPKYMDIRMMMMVMVMLMSMVSMCCACSRVCYMYMYMCVIIVIVLYLPESVCPVYLRNVALNLSQFASPCTSTCGSCIAVFCTIDTFFRYVSSLSSLVFTKFVQFAMFCGNVVIA